MLQAGDDFKFIHRRMLAVQTDHLPDIFHSVLVPVTGKIQGYGRERKTAEYGFRVFLEEGTSGKPVDQLRVKGYGNVLAVLILVHITCMKGIGIAKKRLAFFQVKGVLIDLVKHFAFFYIGKFDFGMPVPQKGAGFIAGKTFITYQKRKGVVSVLFQFFACVVGNNLHEISPFFLLKFILPESDS